MVFVEWRLQSSTWEVFVVWPHEPLGSKGTGAPSQAMDQVLKMLITLIHKITIIGKKPYILET